MDGVLIYPTAFNECTLRIIGDTCILQTRNQSDYIQLIFTSNLQNSVFKCELLVATDGGLPYLIVNDILNWGNGELPSVYTERFNLIKYLLNDLEYFDVNNVNNEYRVRWPTLFTIDEIVDVFDYVIPNYYGVVYGVLFTQDLDQDKQREIVGCQQIDEMKTEVKLNIVAENKFTIKKTHQSDIYEIYEDTKGTVPIQGNNIAYIPTLELSRKLTRIMANTILLETKCIFNEMRQKWIPSL